MTLDPVLLLGFGFGIGTQELIIVGLIVLVLFGHRLPAMMGSLGSGIRLFKKNLHAEDSAELPHQESR